MNKAFSVLCGEILHQVNDSCRIFEWLIEKEYGEYMKNNNLREMFGNNDGGTQPGSINRILRQVIGWALLAAAAGIFFDEYACGGCTQGSIGLIPLYLGFPIGSIGLVIIFKKVAGWISTAIAAVGVAGILYFMFAYPNGVNGWIGGISLGIAHLFLPLPGRFVSVLWVAVGKTAKIAFSRARCLFAAMRGAVS